MMNDAPAVRGLPGGPTGREGSIAARPNTLSLSVSPLSSSVDNELSVAVCNPGMESTSEVEEGTVGDVDLE